MTATTAGLACATEKGRSENAVNMVHLNFMKRSFFMGCLDVHLLATTTPDFETTTLPRSAERRGLGGRYRWCQRRCRNYRSRDPLRQAGTAKSGLRRRHW